MTNLTITERREAEDWMLQHSMDAQRREVCNERDCQTQSERDCHPLRQAQSGGEGGVPGAMLVPIRAES